MRKISLLWVDSLAGLIVGVFMLLLSGPLSRLYDLPQAGIVFMGTMNLAYGSHSFSLARRKARPKALLLLLIAANACWGVLCIAAAFAFASSASYLGVGSLAFEGLFVGGLAILEWRRREILLAGG